MLFQSFSHPRARFRLNRKITWALRPNKGRPCLSSRSNKLLLKLIASMENDVLVNQIEVSTSHGAAQNNCSGEDAHTPTAAAPTDIKVLIRSLIEQYGLTREQLTGIYDEYLVLKSQAMADAGVENASSEDVKSAQGEEEDGMEQGRGEEEEGDGTGENAKGVQGEVGKMQNLVRSAIESYETSPSVFTDLGAKRKQFTLEEELSMQPSPFAQELLE